MTINDDPAPDHQLPLFLAEEFDEIRQQTPSRVFKFAVLVMAAAVIAGAIVIWGEPATRLATVAQTLAGASAQAPDTDQATTAPSSDPAQAAQSAGAEGTNGQPTTAPASADQRQAGAGDGNAALFRSFQAWAQQQDGKPDSQPQESAQQSEPPAAIQDAAAEPVTPNPPSDWLPTAPAQAEPAAPVRAVTAQPQKPKPVRELRNARAEMEAARRAQAKVAHATPTRSQSADDGRGQDTPAQSSQSPSLLQIFGLHN